MQTLPSGAAGGGDGNRAERVFEDRAMVFVILPAYNEEAALRPLLEGLRDSLGGTGTAYRVVVVDDGSTDRTGEVAREYSRSMPVGVVEHPNNKGLAEALRTGLQEAVREASPDDLIVTMDSDNTQTPGLIPRMADEAGRGSDVVIASRYRKGSQVVGVPAFRRLLSHGASILFRVLFPIRGVRDYTCGYRAYRASAIRRMHEHYGTDFISEQGFSCMVDILLKMRRHGVKMSEVPLVLRYDLKPGASKMKVLKTILQTLRLVLRRIGG